MPIAVHDIAVIIPAVNEQQNIAQCVASAVAAGATEILVVDGGSTDRTVHIAARAGARVVTSPAGRSIQLNRGVQETDKPILCFLHADNQLSADALQQAALFFTQDKDNSWACFRQRIEAAGICFRLLEWGNDWRAKWLARVYGDQCMMISHTLFDAVGGFAEVEVMEDVLLSRALRRRGIRPRLLSEPLLINPRRWKQNGVIRQTLRNWRMLLQLRLGRDPDEIAQHYQRHDQ